MRKTPKLVSIAASICLLAGVVAGPASSADSTDAAAAGGSQDRFIKAMPKEVERGENLRVHGKGFGPRVKIRIKFGEPGGPLETEEIITSNRNGGFKERYRVTGSSQTGKAVVAACRRSCKVKEKDTFRVLP